MCFIGTLPGLLKEKLITITFAHVHKVNLVKLDHT